MCEPWSKIAYDAFTLYFFYFLAEGMTPTVETNLFFEICPTNLLAGTEQEHNNNNSTSIRNYSWRTEFSQGAVVWWEPGAKACILYWIALGAQRQFLYNMRIYNSTRFGVLFYYFFGGKFMNKRVGCSAVFHLCAAVGLFNNAAKILIPRL